MLQLLKNNISSVGVPCRIRVGQNSTKIPSNLAKSVDMFITIRKRMLLRIVSGKIMLKYEDLCARIMSKSNISCFMHKSASCGYRIYVLLMGFMNKTSSVL